MSKVSLTVGAVCGIAAGTCAGIFAESMTKAELRVLDDKGYVDMPEVVKNVGPYLSGCVASYSAATVVTNAVTLYGDMIGGLIKAIK